MPQSLPDQDWSRFPVIPALLWHQLLQIEPSRHGECEYRPARVVLRTGQTYDRVYLVEARRYIRVWGLWPEDSAKKTVELGEVERLEESRLRLPAQLANKVYDAGESHMGCHVFTVILSDGRRLPCATGNAVDFPSLPEGVTSADVVDVVPHEGGIGDGSGPPAQLGPDCHWCLYNAPS